jgi:hypothetical protein
MAVVATTAPATGFPAFEPLPALITDLVGYQLPVVCEPSLEKGTVIAGITLTVTYNGQTTTHSPQYGPTPDTEAGVTLFASFARGAVVTVSYGGQTAMLPPIPATTPMTAEDNVPSPYVSVPIAIALDLSVCNIWPSTRPETLCGVYCGVNDHGSALLVAIHEAMHARYAEGNEALTECRAVKTYPSVLAAVFPTLVEPSKEPAKPAKPDPPHKLSSWKTSHPALWKALQTKYRLASARWQAAYRRWKPTHATWENQNTAWTTQQGTKTAMTSGAHAMDVFLPPEYHGGSC